jgi:hypothetical protein
MKQQKMTLLASLILAGFTIWLSRGQAPKLLDLIPKEQYPLMLIQYSAFTAHLEAKGQTNAIEFFRQYRCSYGADLSSSELRDTVTILQHLRRGQTNEAIQLLEQHLSRYSNLMCNSYGGLNATNRSQVNVEPLRLARDYFVQFQQPQWGVETEKAIDVILGQRKDSGK